MTDEEKQHIYLAAINLGFTEYDDKFEYKLTCTLDQLCELLAICARVALDQARVKY